MLPEIQLLCEVFMSQSWDKTTQKAFMDELEKSDFFEGSGSAKEKDFAARDRITRAPKALGFVDLKPKIQLTEAGRELIYGKRPQEVFLRQLLKFQIPSPFHSEHKNISGTFYVRPYLEIMRLVFDLEYLTFDEFKIFAIQLTDYRKYEIVKNAILSFREEKENRRGKYKLFVNEEWERAIRKIYNDKIYAGEIRTRQKKNSNLKEFIQTKKGTMRDYADACFRYLRFTGLFAFKGRSLIVSPDKIMEASHVLETVDRNPVHTHDMKQYTKHLFCVENPVLYADNKENLIGILMRLTSSTRRELSDLDLNALKDLRDDTINEKRNALVREQEKQLKSYDLYQEVVDTFNEIISDEIYDAPLFLEWNAWRAMTMINGGRIKGNFKIDDLGHPMSTAPGNMPDIECDYGDFSLSVEVTLQSGQRQYETEGEPVSRHYGQLLKRSGKVTYCLFVAPTINPASLAHFFVTNKTDIAYYGGKTRIIPLELDQFMRLVESSYSYPTHPCPSDIRSFLDAAISQLDVAQSEQDWKEKIGICVDSWLT